MKKKANLDKKGESTIVTLAGSKFDKMIADGSKNVLVTFMMPWSYVSSRLSSLVRANSLMCWEYQASLESDESDVRSSCSGIQRRTERQSLVSIASFLLSLLSFTFFFPLTQCIVALVDTNDVQNKHINRKYELVTFPNVKFFPAGSANKATKFVDYEGPRTEAALVDYLNEQCGTNVVVSGSGGRAHDGAEL